MDAAISPMRYGVLFNVSVLEWPDPDSCSSSSSAVIRRPAAELSSRVGLFRSRLRTLRTFYHPTLDSAVLWTPSNDTSRPICADSLNLMPPPWPIYLRTLRRYTKCCYYYDSPYSRILSYSCSWMQKTVWNQSRSTLHLINRIRLSVHR